MESNTSSTEITCDIFSIHTEMPLWEAIITIISLSIFVVITIVGNIFVVFSVFTYIPLRIPQNFYLVSLAFADLTVAIIVMPINIIASITKEWILGPIMCQIWLLCDVLCCTASILNLCAIALDRFRAATDPWHYAQQRTLKRVVIMALGVWIISAIISSPLLYFWKEQNKNATSCTVCCLPTFEGYIIYSSSGSFYIPLLIMAFINTKIFLATRKRHRDRAKVANLPYLNSVPERSQDSNIADRHYKMGSENRPMNDPVSSQPAVRRSRVSFADHVSNRNQTTDAEVAGNSDDDQDIIRERRSSPENGITKTTQTFQSIFRGSFLSKTFNIRNKNLNTSAELYPAKAVELEVVARRRRISLSKERKSARALGIVMGVFVICWLPFFLMYVILPFNKHLKLPPRIINLITWLGYVNSALDPFIYTIFNMDFRRALKKLLRIKSSKPN